jgi:hypothetical protein
MTFSCLKCEAKSHTGVALARLDERVARSPVGSGWIERSHFADACASLWIDGELVHLEDLVLHDAGQDIRTPTHELTIAREVLRSRRRIASQPEGWALSVDGIRSLRGQAWPGQALTGAQALPEGAGGAIESSGHAPEMKAAAGAGEADELSQEDPLAAELAAIDAVLARSEAAITDVRSASRRGDRGKDPLVYDLNWDEDERLDEWRAVLAETEDLPPVLRAIVVLDAWNALQVLQHAPWLGRLLAGSVLCQAGVTSAAHLAAVNFGLRSIPIDQRRHPRRETRLLAMARGLIAAAETGLKEHDRLILARQVMERKLIGRRTSSKLPELIELVVGRPLVHSGTVSKVLGVTPQAALKIIGELGLREMTGRGRFRAWGIL